MLGCSIHLATLWKNLLYIITACRGEGNFKCIPQESKHEDIIPKYIDTESWRYHSDVPGYDVKSNITSIYGISMIKTIQSDIIQISFRCPKFLDAFESDKKNAATTSQVPRPSLNRLVLVCWSNLTNRIWFTIHWVGKHRHRDHLVMTFTVCHGKSPCY